MKKIMVVDDNADIILAVKAALEEYDPTIKIIAASNGKQCLGKLKQEIPDLILLDIMMPEMDGWDVVEKIHENKDLKKIPIIFLTAKGDKLTKTFASVSVEDYIVKPVSKDVLINRIEKTLETKNN